MVGAGRRPPPDSVRHHGHHDRRQRPGWARGQPLYRPRQARGQQCRAGGEDPPHHRGARLRGGDPAGGPRHARPQGRRSGQVLKTGPKAKMMVQDTRLAATARYLATEGLDGLLALNGGQNSFLESHAVFVLAGVRPIGESAVLVDRTGAATLMVTPAWEAERASALSRTPKIIGTDDLPQALAAALADLGIEPLKTITVGLSTLGLAL